MKKTIKKLIHENVQNESKMKKKMNKIKKRKNKTKMIKEKKEKIKLEKEIVCQFSATVYMHISPKKDLSAARTLQAGSTTAEDGARVLKYILFFIYLFILFKVLFYN